MQPNMISAPVARARNRDDVARANARRRSTHARPSRRGAHARSPQSASITIRLARPGEAPDLELLAELDSRRDAWSGTREALVAEVGGRVVAALSLDGRVAIADPFVRTQPLVSMLEVRAGQLDRARRRLRRRVLGRLIPRVA